MTTFILTNDRNETVQTIQANRPAQAARKAVKVVRETGQHLTLKSEDGSKKWADVEAEGFWAFTGWTAVK